MPTLALGLSVPVSPRADLAVGRYALKLAQVKGTAGGGGLARLPSQVITGRENKSQPDNSTQALGIQN